MKKEYFWIGLASIILGIVLAQQIKIVNNMYLQGLTPNQRANELTLQLDAVKNEKLQLEKDLEDVVNQLKAIEEAESKENALIKQLKDEITAYETFAGLTDVVGSGVVITLNEPQTEQVGAYEVSLVYDFELFLRLINELNSAGAEAISVNDQRIIGTTEIRAAGNHINVNTVPLSPPYVVEAIGNTTTLEGAVNQRFGIVSQIRDLGYIVDVDVNDYVEIEKYIGGFQFDYAQPVD